MIKLSGFTFVRNVLKQEYPVLESINSILPIVDEFIINVGPSDDGTLELIRAIDDPKIKIIESQWNPHLVKGAYVYAQQTNIALFNCMGKWAFHIQVDEVVHDQDLPKIMEYVDRYIDDDRVEGLGLEQMTFFGDYQTVMNVYPYKDRIRCWIVKPHRFVLSRGDAAGFTVHPKFKEKGRRLRAVHTGARLFHYSNIKTDQGREAKRKTQEKYWSEREFGDHVPDYYSNFPRQFVSRYEGTHPKTMIKRIEEYPAVIDLDSPLWRRSLTWKERSQIIKTAPLYNRLVNLLFGKGSYVLLNE